MTRGWRAERGGNVTCALLMAFGSDFSRSSLWFPLANRPPYDPRYCALQPTKVDGTHVGGARGGGERAGTDSKRTHTHTHKRIALVVDACYIVGAKFKFVRGCTFGCMCEELTQALQKKDGEESEDSGEEEEGGGNKKSMLPYPRTAP
jgi:hypothetical protein